MDKCEQCENEYKSISKHWAGSKNCKYPELSNSQEDVITGIVMGDGCIKREKGKNPKLVVEMTSQNYLHHIADIFSPMGGDVRVGRTPEELAKNSIKSGNNLNAKAENYNQSYVWMFSHPQLQKFADWYSTGKKVWPKDIELTPTVLKHWYCGDGCWRNKNGNNRIVIAMANESRNTGKVTKMFENVGLPRPINYDIVENRNGQDCRATFSVEQSKTLWKYMGKPLPDFEYKWPEVYH